MTGYIPQFETQRDEQAPRPWTNCNAASVSMLIDLWTWGRTQTSDIPIRRASPVPLDKGMNYAAVADAVLKLFPTLGRMLYSEHTGGGTRQIDWRTLRDQIISKGGGAAVNGTYSSLAGHKTSTGLAVNRWQPSGTFGHTVFVCDYDPVSETLLWMDPLGHGEYKGDRINIRTLWEFIWRDGNGPDARITAAYGFATARPAKPVDTDWAGKVTAFGTRYPEYVNSDAEALAWVNRNIKRLIAGGTVWKWGK